MTTLHELEERILRLEKQNLELKRARKGLIVEPALNILGQNTRIDGNLLLGGNAVGVWQDWTPNYTQYWTMTYTSITTHQAKFCITGKLLHFKIDSAGTLGGTPMGSLAFSPPVAPSPEFTGAGFVFSLGVVVGGVSKVGFGNSTSSGSVFIASLFDKANFSAGAIRFVGYGFYEIA